MSTIGKVFVVINLAFAALFVGAAASLIGTSEGWRAQAEELEANLAATTEAKDGEIASLQTNVDQLENERDRVKASRTQVETDRDALAADLATEQAQNADLRERLTGIEGRLGDLEGTNRAQATRITDLNRETRDLRSQRDDALAAKASADKASTAAKDSAAMAEGRASDLTIELARSNERAGELDAQLATVASLYKIDLNSLNAQPDQSGVVLSADYVGVVPVVVINIGRADGVRAGYSYDVYSGSTYKGRIRVETVGERQAGATIAMDAGAHIEGGDRVVTRL